MRLEFRGTAIDYFALVRSWMLRAVSLGAKQTIRDPSKPGFEDTELRAKLILEEAIEFVEACGFEVWAADGYSTPDVQPPLETDPQPNFLLAIDALCDLLYVVFGTFVTWGLHPAQYFAEVHRSNETKLLAGVVVREDGKILKSPSFAPPDLQKILHQQNARGAWDTHTLSCARCEDYASNRGTHVPPTPCDLGKELIDALFLKGSEERAVYYAKKEGTES